MLPKKAEEAGYYTYGTPPSEGGQYVHPAMLTFLFWLETHWSAIEDRKR